MDLTQVKTLLEDTFSRECSDGKRRHIVFWYDENGEFKDDIREMTLANAKIIEVSNNNYFHVKYVIEKEDPNSNFLIYAPFQKPKPKENDLLDIYQYSEEFTTEKAVLIMRDLSISDDSLKEVFRRHIKFFNNKERYQSFREYGIENYTSEETVEVAILSVLCKLPYSDFDECLRVLLMEANLDDNRFIEAVEKFGDKKVIWNLANKYYGYEDKEPTMKKLAISMLVTNMAYSLSSALPEIWQKYVLSRKADCVVFLSNFMNHSLYAAAYNRLANSLEQELRVQEYIDKWEMDDYIDCDTFKVFDDAIIKKLTRHLLTEIGEFEKYRDIIQARRTSHWYTSFQPEYACIGWSIELLDNWKEVKQKLRQLTPTEYMKGYTEQFYKLDTAYRKFYLSFDKTQNREELIELKEIIENTYVNGYLNSLSIRWCDSLETQNQSWIIPGMISQKDFYQTFIRPFVKRSERIFVIISDALRYEAAREFCDLLNRERKGSTEIEFMQGSIPSSTRLGMATLLPHKTITMNGEYRVTVDGLSSEGTENRSRILKKYSQDSIAIQYEDVMNMKREQFRKTFSGQEMIYIYHNNIDARGDHSSTEREVFHAVEEAFEELKGLINNLVNHVSATNILITADHGFLYQRDSLQESDKISRGTMQDAYENRRFMLITNPIELEGTLTLHMEYLPGSSTNLRYITPRGMNRFKIQGAGANYVHGGTSLQEIVIPVIKFKNDRRKNSKNEVKKADVKLTSITRKITNIISYLEFFQTEKIEEKRVPLRLKTYFIDEEGNRISNENIIIADSRSEVYEERSFREKFVLKNKKYDKSKKYYLLLEEDEEAVGKVHEKIPFMIDIAVSDDDQTKG